MKRKELINKLERCVNHLIFTENECDNVLQYTSNDKVKIINELLEIITRQGIQNIDSCYIFESVREYDKKIDMLSMQYEIKLYFKDFNYNVTITTYFITFDCEVLR